MLRDSSYSFRMRNAADRARARVLFVTPFAAFPPRHGGARRVAEMVRGVRNAFDVALVTDEGNLYGAHSCRRLRRPGRRVPGAARPDRSARWRGNSLADRMRSHCHPALVAAVAQACREFDPDLVQVEHAELAPLAAHRTPGARWLLDLHDAYGADDFAHADEAAVFAASLSRYGAAIASLPIQGS